MSHAQIEKTPVYVGFDVGGTFTDVIVVANGNHVIEKVLTTPSDPSDGAKRGIGRALEKAGLGVESVDATIHGTTLVANAIIERRGARTGVITNRGMRDALEIGTGTRYDIYDFFLPFPKPLVERRLRREIGARLGPDGQEIRSVDRAEVEGVLNDLRAEGVESIAVCLLHSYRNDAHEEAVLEIGRELCADIAFAASADVVGKIGEDDRFSTAVANAYVRPLMLRYLSSLEEWLGEGRLFLMGSSGGTVGVSAAGRWPIRLIESGPAAGALAASSYSRRLGRADVVSFDMGGTTAKICLIDGGAPRQGYELEVARQERFKPGSGVPLSISTFDLLEIGAGGGSIARVDELGLLKVGPRSAGADPGPACYQRGGTEPTVTDANLVLGYLGEDSFLGGDMTLDREAAEEAVRREIGDRLSLEDVEAAWGIYEVVNEAMAAALRTHVIERNRDPRTYSLIAFGGAGPTHAVAVARKVGLEEVVVPLGAGAMSAIGLVIAPAVMDVVHSYVTPIEAIDWGHVGDFFERMERDAVAVLHDAGVEFGIEIDRSVDMRYIGQSHEITIPVPRQGPDTDMDARLLAEFQAKYAELYTYLNPRFGVEVMTWRLRASGPERIGYPRTSSRETATEPAGLRPAYFPDQGFVDVPVYEQARLAPGFRIAGPAVIEQRESTTVLGPSDGLEVTDDLGLAISVGASR
ncbi:MAG TPA: hydantoinase/oxoprolinase family protein [Thermoleophilaceae bacterium]|nr:hydantoinase/oxoprolinase family protein [Thermoleophilaceae bacterium]